MRNSLLDMLYQQKKDSNLKLNEIAVAAYTRVILSNNMSNLKLNTFTHMKIDSYQNSKLKSTARPIATDKANTMLIPNILILFIQFP